MRIRVPLADDHPLVRAGIRRTVRRHLQEIYCRLGVNTREEATAQALTLGLVEK